MSSLEGDVPPPWREFLGGDVLGLLPEPGSLGSYQPRRLFRALEETSPDDVRLVLLGMDPYPTPGVPEGLAFSVPPGQPIPASLRNLFQEREADLGLPPPESGSLLPWAREGVLLWNVALSVLPGQAGSQLSLWRPFSEAALRTLADKPFLLLGRHAQKAAAFAEFRIEAPHPSPLSAWRGFWGSRPFSRSNALLEEMGQKPLSWKL